MHRGVTCEDTPATFAIIVDAAAQAVAASTYGLLLPVGGDTYRGATR